MVAFTTIVVWVGLNDVVASVWFYQAGGGMFPIPIFLQFWCSKFAVNREMCLRDRVRSCFSIK